MIGHEIKAPKGWTASEVVTNSAPVRLHLGCGGVRLDGYLNCDIRPEVKPDMLFDLTETWPFEDGYAKEVIALHVLEHLDRHEGAHFLREAARVLAPGGKLILELPDLGAVCAAIGRGQVGPREPHGYPLRILNLFGAQREGPGKPFDFHRFGYTRETLAWDVERAGFRVVSQGDGTDYHANVEPCQRLEAVRRSGL